MGIRMVRDLQEGEVLSRAVIGDEGQLLIPEGMDLKKEYISILETLGIESVYVVEEIADEEMSFLDEHEFQCFVVSVRDILGRYIYKVNKTLYPVLLLAGEIVDCLQEKRNDSRKLVFYNRRADLYEHTVMVTVMCVYLGLKMKMTRGELEDLAAGALLHDMGLRFVTTSFDGFEEEERTAAEIFELKKHTIMAFTVLDGESWIPRRSAGMALSHHERLDGSGYPLKQKNQDMFCRIIQICDAFDCMMSGMECRRRSLEEAVDYLIRNKGILFDKEIVEIFVKNIKSQQSE